MELKDIIIWFLIILAVGLIIAYIQNPKDFSSFKSIISPASSDYPLISLVEFNKNQSSFIGKNVTIKAKATGHYARRGNCDDTYLFTDVDGYSIDVCPTIKRDFTPSQAYTLKGTIEESISNSVWGSAIMLISKP